MHTFDFIGFFTTFMQLVPGAPLIHRCEINELTGRCRTAVATFLRFWPFRLAVAFGRWRETGLSEPEMFQRVFRSRSIDLYDSDGHLDPRFLVRAREQVAKQATDPDEEWTILEMLDLDT